MSTTSPPAPPAPASTSTISTKRPQIIGPESGPEKPFPLRLGGEVVSGFGRGSKELGIPTANIPVPTSPSSWITNAQSGVYFGWCSLLLPPGHPSLLPSSPTSGKEKKKIPSSKILDEGFVAPRCPPFASEDEEGKKDGEGKDGEEKSRRRVYPMVMSIGYNPFYKNKVRSAEVHVLEGFEEGFYGCEMRVLLLGFIREELDYTTLEALIQDIKIDCEVAARSLSRENWVPAGEDERKWLFGEGKAEVE